MKTPLPTGVVTFLMTDVADSTRLWDSDGTGMAASLALHDLICREETSAHGGHVFSTAGDAFSVAFPGPGDALDAALDIQRRLAEAEWPGPEIRVRMGIHTGTADERDGDYFGPTLNRTARVMAAGHGGHVLVSSLTADLLGSLIGATLDLVDRGVHRLSGLSESERIFEVTHPHGPQPTLPLRTEDVRTTNLTDPLSSFVGRSAELADLADRLQTSRLVTLTGAGGTGKTRLAIEGARRAMSSFTDGAWIVELAPISDDSLVMSSVGDVFGLRPGEGASIEDVVVRHLASRELLLVVDNCEHVLDGAVASIRRVLEGAPHVKVLATSRESLGFEGETVVRVPSLSVPGGSTSGTAESVMLFLDRARSGGAEPAADEMPAVERICRQVEGIPLGIELAAARLRTMSPLELADRLEDSFRVLAGRAKTSLPRHRNLEATIDWSYDLLDADERDLFRRISVFTGGFDLDAAESVGPPGSAFDVIDTLDSLVDKSLVTSRRTEHGTRFRMLEPVRQYARRRLEDEGEVDSTLDAHARHFAGFAASASRHTRGIDQTMWDRRIDADYDNIRLAFHTLLVTDQIDRYLGLAFDLFMYWVHTCLHLEAIRTCVEGLEAAGPSVDRELIVKVWFVVACLGAETTSPVAIEHARRGLEVAHDMGEPNAIARMELALGAAIRHSTTDPEYLEHLLVARSALDQNAESPWWEPAWDRAFLNLLLTGYLPASDERSSEHAEVATTTFERVGDRAMLGATLVEGIGNHFSDTDRVKGDLRRALEIFEDVRAGYFQAHARMTLGVLLHFGDEPDEAAVHLAEGADQLEDFGDFNCWATSSRWLAESESSLGMTDLARSRLIDVIDRLDQLPMHEVAIPRTLDAAAIVLNAAGLQESAAVVLGCAELVPFTAESILPRASRLEQLASTLEEVIGADAAAARRAEGASLDPLDCLSQARAWLAS
jgi:predicted ATPase/class 3 adenylate cyclase